MDLNRDGKIDLSEFHVLLGYPNCFYCCPCILKSLRQNILSYLFWDCSSLEHINLNSFNTYQVINISHMFENCSSLKELNLSSFNTNKVTNMSFIFHNCSSLQELNLSSFNFENIKDVSNIFYNQRIYCKLICKNERVCNYFLLSLP